MTPGWERWFVSNLPLFGLIVVCAHLVMSCGQTLMHCWLGHHRLGGRFFHNHINFHHTYYARGHLTSAVYRGTDGNVVSRSWWKLRVAVVSGGVTLSRHAARSMH